ncbi:MAG: aldo/keto reductase [Cryobacterium sp.]|nr:aldo/keto reductase [Cryobacterium sp.]
MGIGSARDIRLQNGTGGAVGRLSYGAAALGNLYKAVDDDQARDTLETAWGLGIRYFDTAPHYGLGLSERRVGEFLAGKHRDDFLLSTKVGRLLEPTPERAGERDDEWFDVPARHRRVWDYSPSGIRQSLEESLSRLGLDRVDILYLHDPEQYGKSDDLPRALDALVGLREEGLVRAVGVGSSDVQLLRDSIRLADLDLLMLSNRYTLLDQSARQNLLPEAREHAVGIVNVGVFNSGLLASPVPHKDSHYEYGSVPHTMLEKSKRLAEVCARHGVELPAVALQYSLRDPAVVTVTVGSRSRAQLRENSERMRVVIPEKLWTDLVIQGLIPA